MYVYTYKHTPSTHPYYYIHTFKFRSFTYGQPMMFIERRSDVMAFICSSNYTSCSTVTVLG